ncbi:unnamed protein product [Cylicocyclus nassatus]|uniref:DDE Tnp4 domain-containing protein n=1 Tax=Cylicocyclus nassatus TaxID=53992 RepID=A0AA36DKI6_CYLNA|nr:unnamed protein product [Cylicocyclus nassatus]
MSYQEWRDVLIALVVLDDAITNAVQRPYYRSEYVRREHAPFLETRFRLYDEYLAAQRPAAFMQFARVFPNEFEDLYQCIAAKLMHSRTHAGPIKGRQRLMIFFFEPLHWTPAVMETISVIVAEVTEAITSELYDIAFPTVTREKLEEVARVTQARLDYPRACGFMDGKHVRYEEFVDANDRVFPPTKDLGQVEPVQYHILVDGGFGQDLRFVRPYRDAEANTSEKRRFNEKHSSARRMIESTFGILARRFQILMHPMQVNPSRAGRIIKVLLALHNLLPRR